MNVLVIQCFNTTAFVTGRASDREKYPASAVFLRNRNYMSFTIIFK